MPNTKINGKYYHMWEEFVDKKDEWIGGILEDQDDDPFIRPQSQRERQGKITDIRLEPNGEDSAAFFVDSEKGSCGFDVKVGGIDGHNCVNGWTAFSGYGGHRWRIRKP